MAAPSRDAVHEAENGVCLTPHHVIHGRGRVFPTRPRCVERFLAAGGTTESLAGLAMPLVGQYQSGSVRACGVECPCYSVDIGSH